MVYIEHIWLLWKSRLYLRCLKITVAGICIVNSVDKSSQHLFCLVRWLFLNGTYVLWLYTVHCALYMLCTDANRVPNIIQTEKRRKIEKYVKENTLLLTRKLNSIALKYTYTMNIFLPPTICWVTLCTNSRL